MSKASRNRLQKAINTLTLKPLRTCRSIHFCEFCNCDIQYGQMYRDGGFGNRVHDECLKTLSKELSNG